MAQTIVARGQPLGLVPLFGRLHRAPGALLLFACDVNDAVDHLTQVVRGHVRRHADRDSGGSVDQQVWNGGGQHRRFLGRFVVVWNEVDGLLVEIRHQVFGQGLKTRLRVAHGRWRVAIDRTKVPLTVDQGIPHVEVLREPHQGVVDRRVSVRMVIAHHLADDLGALAIRAVRGQTHLPHAVEHAAMRRFQAVTNVRQRAPDDYAHRVIHVRALHLVFDVDGDLRCGGFHVSREAPGSGPRLRSSQKAVRCSILWSGGGRRVWSLGPGARGPNVRRPGSSQQARCLR